METKLRGMGTGVQDKTLADPHVRNGQQSHAAMIEPERWKPSGSEIRAWGARPMGPTERKGDMTQTMMACGHAANATYGGDPACAICAGIDYRATVPMLFEPDLTTRKAICGCGRIEPSSTSLPFFEYRGEHSRMAVDSCDHCGYALIAHTQEPTRTQRNVIREGRCPGFEPRGAWAYDSFYCGCRGWDDLRGRIIARMN